MNSKVFKRLLSYIGRYKGKFIVGVILGFLGIALNVMATVILGEITTILFAGVEDGKWFAEDEVYITIGSMELGKLDTIALIIVILVVMYILTVILLGFANKIFSNVASLVVRDLRNEIDEKMHRMQLNYYDTRTNGEILSVITNDVESINTAIGKNLYNTVTQSFNLIFILAMMIYINIWLALIAVCMGIATLIAFKCIIGLSNKNYAAQQELLGDLNGYVEEMINGQNVISTFNYQDRAKNEFETINENLRIKAEKAQMYSGSIMPVTQTINNVGYGASALVACLLALGGSISVGNVQSILQYTKQFSMPFTTFAQMSGQLAAAGAAGKRIFELLDAEEEIPDTENGKVPANADGTVAFNHVKFGYNPETPLMTDVSIDVKPGQKCAIVGPTGAGKTTLVNLLMRFYEIDGGQIVVDGIDTKEMTRHELRNHFGMVLQDTWLFEGTIRDNLKYSTTRDVSDEEMEKACESICADTFIKTMPGGYDMKLSKGAENISQGQRQLLTIARAIIADPEIMILDEATSNVDAHTEQIIQNAMATLMKGRTSFVIAHRLSTIRDSDMILYMENGDIKEVGDHDALMKQGGKYAALYNSQFG